MTRRRFPLLATIGVAFLSGALARAQEVAQPAPPDSSNPLTFILLLLPFVFLALLVVTMRRSKRVQPLMDRSILIAEEDLQLAREQVALQKETNRLLGQLVAERQREG